MARATELKPKITIKDVQHDERIKYVDRTLVSFEVDNGKRKWNKVVSILTPDRPLSLEEFVIILRDNEEIDLKPPEEEVDPLKYLKEAIETKKPIEVDLSGPVAKVDAAEKPEE